MDLAFLSALETLTRQQEDYVMVTVVKVLGSVPPELGSKMLVTQAGLLTGTVGGGKLEQKALAQALQILSLPPETQAAKLETWHLQLDVGMTCGGSVTLFFEPQSHQSWPVAIFGAGHVAQALVRALLPLRTAITCLDSRSEWLEKLPPEAQLNGRLTMKCLPEPASAVELLPENTMIVVMTMGHASDVPILKAVFERGGFPYVGVIGSEAKAVRLRQELRGLGVSDEAMSTMVCPIGLPLGGNEPAEIAISVAAQLLQERDRLLKADG